MSNAVRRVSHRVSRHKPTRSNRSAMPLLTEYLETKRCDGCGCAICTHPDHDEHEWRCSLPWHCCGLCPDCWGKLTREQQNERDRQITARHEQRWRLYYSTR
jgi:hypothetical protein